jgi:hypothetical protein
MTTADPEFFRKVTAEPVWQHYFGVPSDRQRVIDDLHLPAGTQYTLLTGIRRHARIELRHPDGTIERSFVSYDGRRFYLDIRDVIVVTDTGAA